MTTTTGRTASTTFEERGDADDRARNWAHSAVRVAAYSYADGLPAWQVLAPAWAEVCAARAEIRAARAYERWLRSDAARRFVADHYGDDLPQARRDAAWTYNRAFWRGYYAARAYRIVRRMLVESDAA